MVELLHDVLALLSPLEIERNRMVLNAVQPSNAFTRFITDIHICRPSFFIVDRGDRIAKSGSPIFVRLFRFSGLFLQIF